MVNGWLYSMEIPRGGMAAMDLELAASSLEEMQLNDPENIENIEFKLRIKTARKNRGCGNKKNIQIKACKRPSIV